MSVYQSVSKSVFPAVHHPLKVPAALLSASRQPLDLVDGVIGAWWLSQLRTDYLGSCIRVRRSSDSAEQDVGFVGGDLDTSSLLEFVGAGHGFVVTMYDQSGNGRNMTQASTANQAMIVRDGQLETIGGKPSMVFDGTNDSYATASTVDLTAIVNMVAYSSLRQTDSDSIRVLFETIPPQTTPGGIGIYQNNGASSVVGVGVGSGGSFLFSNTAPVPVPATYSLTAVFTPSQSTKSAVRIGGQAVSLSAVAASGTVTDDAFQDQVLRIGSRAGASFFYQGSLSGLILVDAALHDTEIESFTEGWVSANYSLTISDLDYSSSQANGGGYIRGSAFSSVEFETEATMLTVGSINDIYSSFANYTRLGVFVDGSYFTEINPGALGASAKSVVIPPGLKTVEVVNGLQSKPSSLIGTWISSVSADAPMSRNSPTQTGGLVAYGDSISVGSDASPIMQNCWFMGLRLAAPYPCRLEGWGFRSLHDDAQNAAQRAALVTLLTMHAPSKIWLAIGTNDYGLSKWSAASFEAAYAALLADLNTALPGVTVYAQTPIVRSSEVSNGFGSTLQNYRDAIGNAASGKSYVTVVDGTTFLATSDLSDGVHPNTAGHGLIEAAVKSTLGII